MPHLPKLIAAAAVALGLAFAAGQAKAAPLPVASGPAAHQAADQALPVEKVHYRGYRYWRWGPRYNYWGPRYYYRPYYYGYGYRPYWYWNRPYYRYWW
jgi:hypothetical protein